MRVGGRRSEIGRTPTIARNLVSGALDSDKRLHAWFAVTIASVVLLLALVSTVGAAKVALVCPIVLDARRLKRVR